MPASVNFSVTPKEIIGVVRRALCLIDERLVEHGERVAFIACKILEYSGRLQEFDWESLVLLSFFHDVGAYKTEEIDNMVAFETMEYFDHSIYGYLFLKYFTPLKDYADAILYHHTSYENLRKSDCQYKNYALLINIADRVDIFNMAGRDPAEVLDRGSGTLFSPELVNAFKQANEGGRITAPCVSGEYRNFIDETDRRLSLPGTELFDYLKMMVFAIDFRSAYTVTHTINTTSIAVAIAKLSGLSRHETTAISYGAFLHDLGKIAIPLTILESPGRLSPGEMDIMKTHVLITDKIIRGIVDDEVCSIAVRHHEKLNGTGYPMGLTDNELTYPEKILAVSDIISALVGRRSYKEPFPKDTVLTILHSMEDAGQLSPKACAAVYEHYDEIMDTAQKNMLPVIDLYNRLSAEYEEIRASREM